MVKCAYCKGEIPKDKYVRTSYKLGIKKGYCSYECKNRAMLLRYGVIHPKKMPKNLDEIEFTKAKIAGIFFMAFTLCAFLFIIIGKIQKIEYIRCLTISVILLVIANMLLCLCLGLISKNNF